MAKPLIATDVPGCRQVVEHGVNGLLCAVARRRARSPTRWLAMLEVDPVERRRMGAAGRARIEAEFDEKKVADRLSRGDRGAAI